MSDNKFKVGDKVRVKVVIPADSKHGINVGMTGEIKEIQSKFNDQGEDGIFVYFGSPIELVNPTYRGIVRDGAYAMWPDQIELAPFEVPASPFYVRHTSGAQYKIEINGTHANLTELSDGEVHNGFCLTRQAYDYVKGGIWTLIDPPEPAVDPVAAAAAEVQRLLREYQAAVIAGDEADEAANKAAENRRNIGKQLEAAKRDLEKANHEAVGIEYSDKFGAKYAGNYGR